MARKPIPKGSTVTQNVLNYGTGAINIDDSRIEANQENFDNLKGRPITKLATQRDGETDEEHKARVLESPSQQEALAKLKEIGRWPANIILDPYTAELLDEQSGVSKSGKNKEVKGTGGIWQKSSGLPVGPEYGDSGGASRFFYVAKASKRDRNEGLEGLPTKGKIFNGQNPDSAGLAEGSVEDKFTTQPSQNFHPTVKPTTLMQYLVKLVTPPNGTVLDPFAGSGSTGKAALLQGFNFIGIELTEDYWPIIEGRLKHAEETFSNGDGKLF
jgi:site-specific DNA-methyltransferase (adenine-specific)